MFASPDQKLRVETWTRKVFELLLTSGHTLVFAAMPMLLVTTSNAANFPADRGVYSALAVVCSLTVLALGVSRAFGGSLAARSAWLSVTIVLLSAYSTLVGRFGGSHAVTLREHPLFAGFYTLTAAALACSVRRPWDPAKRRTPMLGMLAVYMLGLAAVPLVRSSLASPQTWRADIEAIASSTVQHTESPARPGRDVFYIVLDSFGREDILSNLYGTNLAGLRAELERQGFYVATQSRSPYAQTMLSLASTLNMSYLDRVGELVGRSSKNRYPLAALLADNALMRNATRAGYQVVAVQSEFAALAALPAEITYDIVGGLSEYQQGAIAMTPLAALPLAKWTHGAHRQNVLRQFATLETLIPPSERPRFVFAHILLPHPPFVFAGDGADRRQDSTWFTLADGDHFRGGRDAYVQGYAGQAQFAALRLRAFLQRIADRTGLPPAVVITGDHGPGSELNWEDVRASNMTERMGVFSAYRFPGVAPDRFYPTISPVNAARILANTYFGTDLPPLPDESAFSTWGRPYDFIKLPPEVEK